MPQMRVQRIGLTGGIGSGKSAVARMLVARGAVLIDADAISRQTTAAGGAAIGAIAAQFGPGLIDAKGALNRDAMRALVFGDSAARSRLEAIVHPLVGIESTRQAAAAAAAGSACIAFDIPLLVESGRWRQQLDLVLVIDCREAVQLSRVLAREAGLHLAHSSGHSSGGAGWTPETVRRVIAGQASRLERLAAADASIYNDGLSLEELDLAVAQIAPRFGL